MQCAIVVPRGGCSMAARWPHGGHTVATRWPLVFLGNPRNRKYRFVIYNKSVALPILRLQRILIKTSGHRVATVWPPCGHRAAIVGPSSSPQKKRHVVTQRFLVGGVAREEDPSNVFCNLGASIVGRRIDNNAGRQTCNDTCASI